MPSRSRPGGPRRASSVRRVVSKTKAQQKMRAPRASGGRAPAREPEAQAGARFVLVAVQELSRHGSADEARVEMAQYEATAQTTYYVARLP